MLVPHDDFDNLTAYAAKCAACSNIKLPEHSTVFRPDIEDDFDGFHDVCQACIEQAAHDVGMVDAKVAVDMRLALDGLRLDRDEIDLRHQEMTDTIKVLTRENVYLQANIDLLTAQLSDEVELPA